MYGVVPCRHRRQRRRTAAAAAATATATAAAAAVSACVARHRQLAVGWRTARTPGRAVLSLGIPGCISHEVSSSTVVPCVAEAPASSN